MQLTFYYNQDDAFLIERANQAAAASRRSVSAVILTALETYFLQEQRLGEILVEMGKVQPRDLERALQAQRQEPDKPLGQWLLELGLISKADLRRALSIQSGRAR